jgi:uncharacterized membrane protein YhhN
MSIIFTYANLYDVIWLKYWSKPFLMPLLAFYYITIAKTIDTKFLVALFFAFCGELLFLNQKESFFILGMSCFLIFILINMIIITKRIGEIKLSTFYVTILPFILVCMAVISIYFGDVGLMKLLFIIYGSVLGLYGAFSLYWYVKEKDKWALLNLIGVLIFFLAAIGKGLKTIEGPKEIYKILNVTFYVCSMLLISISYANHTIRKDGNSKKKLFK